MTLSKSERKFLREFLATQMLEKPSYIKLRDEKYSSDYLAVLKHRINQKEQQLKRDLELISNAKDAWPKWWEKNARL